MTKPEVSENLYELLENIDAVVFGRDSLYYKDNLTEFKKYLHAWNKAIERIEEELDYLVE